MHKVVIVGAGRDGAAVLTTLSQIDSIQVVGITDIRADAPAFSLARKLGIEAASDTDRLVRRPDVDVIFEVTGRPEVMNSIMAAKNPRSQVVGAAAASVLLEIINSRNSLRQSIEQQAAELRSLAEAVAETGERIGRSINELTASASQLASSGQNLSAAAAQTEVSLGEVEEVLGFIRQVANKTRMIGLNAAIEAARVGEAGKGFAVVASEVRKLAQTSNQSAENISKSLGQTLSSVKQILQGVVTAHEFAEKQAAATAEVDSALRQLTEMVGRLNSIARQLALRE
jgi:methyl-accepting chemotaxis protein